MAKSKEIVNARTVVSDYIAKALGAGLGIPSPKEIAEKTGYSYPAVTKALREQSLDDFQQSARMLTPKVLEAMAIRASDAEKGSAQDAKLWFQVVEGLTESGFKGSTATNIQINIIPASVEQTQKVEVIE
jgi:hypothetical protein